MLTTVSQRVFLELAFLSQVTDQVTGSSAQANDQSYIFGAYGMVCVLLFAFTLWTLVEVRRLGKHVSYLQERIDRAKLSGEE